MWNTTTHKIDVDLYSTFTGLPVLRYPFTTDFIDGYSNYTPLGYAFQPITLYGSYQLVPRTFGVTNSP